MPWESTGEENGDSITLLYWMEQRRRRLKKLHFKSCSAMQKLFRNKVSRVPRGATDKEKLQSYAKTSFFLSPFFFVNVFSSQWNSSLSKVGILKGENCTLFAPKTHESQGCFNDPFVDFSLSLSSSSSFFFSIYFQIMGRVNFSAASSALKLLWASAALSRSRLRCGDGQQLFPVINCNSHRHLSQASAPNHWITFRTTRTF